MAQVQVDRTRQGPVKKAVTVGSSPGLVVALVFLGLWFGLASSYPSYLLPDPRETLDALVGLFARRGFGLAVAATAAHMGVAFLITAVIGIPLGILMGRVPAVEASLRGVVPVIETVPRLITITVAIVLLKLTDQGVVFVGVISALPFTVIGVWQGARNVDHDLMEMGAVYGHASAALMRRIVIPAVMPDVLSSLRITMGMLWHAVLVTEFIMGVRGIGREINVALSTYQIPDVFAWGVLVVLAMYLIEALMFRIWERRVLAWKRQRGGQ